MSVGFLKDFQKEEFLVATLVRGMPTNACGKGDGVEHANETDGLG